jgi:hypothetical protein
MSCCVLSSSCMCACPPKCVVVQPARLRRFHRVACQHIALESGQQVGTDLPLRRSQVRTRHTRHHAPMYTDAHAVATPPATGTDGWWMARALRGHRQPPLPSVPDAARRRFESVPVTTLPPASLCLLVSLARHPASFRCVRCSRAHRVPSVGWLAAALLCCCYCFALVP